MSEFIKVAAFSVIALLAFPLYAQFGLPPVIPPRGMAPPPGAAELGRWVYETKGACAVCHNRLLGRAPDLGDAPARARAALADAAYSGSAMSEREYLIESLVAPSAYVVPGFGRPGTHDRESPMPSARANEMRLTDEEIEAVVDFMMPGGADAAASPRAPAATAAEAFVIHGCHACHAHPLIAQGAGTGPDLAHAGAMARERLGDDKARAFIRESIISPNAVIADGYEPDVMPGDYADKVDPGELALMVEAIVSAGETP